MSDQSPVDWRDIVGVHVHAAITDIRDGHLEEAISELHRAANIVKAHNDKIRAHLRKNEPPAG